MPDTPGGDESGRESQSSPPASALPDYIIPNAPPPPPTTPPQFIAPQPLPPAPWETRPRQTRAVTATISALLVVVIVAAAIALVLVNRPGTGPAGSATGALFSAQGGLASPTPTADPAAVAKARHDYVAAEQQLIAAIQAFGVELDRDATLPCRCPPGEFDPRPAFRILSSVAGSIQVLIATLRTIAGELPQYTTDISAYITDLDSMSSDIANASTAADGGDLSLAVADLSLIESVIQLEIGAETQVDKDLGLPVPSLTVPTAAAA